MPQCTSPVKLEDAKHSFTIVPCGRCPSCCVNRTEMWATRILHESRLYNDNVFCTFTYDEQNLPDNGSISRRELQLFFKRLRKQMSFRYFACGEYGEKYSRPHYHAILFGVNKKVSQKITSTWNKGFCYYGEVNEKTARYCAKYVQKQLHGDERQIYDILGIQREFLLSSRRPGIGSEYIKNYLDQWLHNGYIIIDGKKRPIPRYYLSKLSEERRKEYSMYRQSQSYKNLKHKEDMNEGSMFNAVVGEILSREQRTKIIRARSRLSKPKL